MKKSLVLAMAMALGVTASAYAANPFSDVPAGHWAYDSVNKLAAAGIVDGYGDSTFGGDKLMTRYEMAQIVAKAMAKGANVDKLAAEFADELDTLGVRVANLEKKADNVKITGQVRFRYQSHDMKGGDDKADMRSRLWIAGQVNDDWTYTAMLQNIQDFDNNSGDEKTEFKRAYVDGRIGGVQVHAGRWDEVLATGAILDAYMDGVKLSYGDKVKVYGIAAKGADWGDTDNTAIHAEDGDAVYVAGLEAQVGAVNGYFNYIKAEGINTDGYLKDAKGDAVPVDKEIYNVGVSFDVAKDLNLAYEYMWSDKKYNKEVSKDGFVATLAYKGADAEVANTWGVHATYYDQPSNAIISPTYDATIFQSQGGYKGWSAGVDYTLAKNIQLCVNYYDTEAKIGNDDDQSIFTELFFFF